jgi:hypothetical protein
VKTDELIEILGTQVEPVDTRTIIRTVGIAAGAGGVVALGAMLLVFGVRTDATTVRAWIFCLTKLVFTLALVIPAFIYLTRLARPGGERRISLALMAAPFAAVVAIGAISLAFAPPSHWDAMITGERWLECLLSIPIIAIAPFATITWALRQTAPTDLTRAGALGGLLAGAVSATGYALHCMDDSLPFIALWYGGTVALCMLSGALLGPKFLRW